MSTSWSFSRWTKRNKVKKKNSATRECLWRGSRKAPDSFVKPLRRTFVTVWRHNATAEWGGCSDRSTWTTRHPSTGNAPSWNRDAGGLHIPGVVYGLSLAQITRHNRSSFHPVLGRPSANSQEKTFASTLALFSSSLSTKREYLHLDILMLFGVWIIWTDVTYDCSSCRNHFYTCPVCAMHRGAVDIVIL